MLNRAHAQLLLAAIVVALACLVPATAGASTHESGGTPYQPPPHRAKIVGGKAVAPADAPDAVKAIIAAANRS